jgi:hypothetical protein
MSNPLIYGLSRAPRQVSIVRVVFLSLAGEPAEDFFFAATLDV